MRRFLGFPVALAALVVAMQPAYAQGLGIHLGGINIGIGGSNGGIGVSVGGTGVSVGSNGIVVGGTGEAAGGATGTGTGDVVEFSQQASVDAVHDQRALPLDVILARARAVTSGQIIDARLIGYRNFLLYDLKVLATTGDVSELYFYARSGVQVQTR
jgi:hypothetical protein